MCDVRIKNLFGYFTMEYITLFYIYFEILQKFEGQKLH